MSSKTYHDQSRIIELLDCYNRLLKGKVIYDRGQLNDYIKDPNGCDISFNIAKVWPSYNAGDRLKD